ncbi:phytanoyl-CoA dioxygenase family protein [Pirellulales bacterium]|nr:phytanoyl-CoA dioxygenase family protein [Pirellulales bacterium]
MSNHYDTLQRDFEKDGFVALRQFIGGDELAELMANLDRFIRDVVPSMPSEQVYYEDKNDWTTLKQIQHMGDHDPYFHELFVASRFREVAEQLLDGPVAPKNMQYFNKPPGVGQPPPPHQDGYYFMLDPCEAVTMWFALDHVDEENGCVRYIRGSHRRTMRPHARTGTLGFSQGIVDYTSEDRDQEVAMPGQPGDLLVHHAMTIHRADGNHSADRTRRALGFIYYSERAQEDTAAHEAYQRKLKEEMASAGRL